MPQTEQELTYIPHERTIANVELNSPKNPTTSKSIFDGRKVVPKLRNDFVKGNEKFEELPVASQSLKEAKKNVKELKVLRDDTKKEVEDVESKVLVAEHEFNKCANISLVTTKASDDVEEKKRVLEVALQDLANYKLCLD
ncbi:hypothetical protein KY290_033692 [Solanum tuberosum]|uniref:Uncharacterized protein n=1 Tax=Solanum tuberosum TaxID=4113 RepID=A0ABQ7U130_SOLTU|nr:hypothetical protein KY289_033061 [Solanum tuberosum]KAH0647704.1 hypothetical protein KY285_032952 [Solanum tuberosum]KAH0740649.1 hypothetical protein KY290_033692 [Solanum tuberosum]